MLHAIDAHSKFHDEYIAFSQARSYLYSAAKLARDGVEPLAEDHADLLERISPKYQSPSDYFLAHLFISYISAFELYLQELVMVVAARYPKKVGGVSFRLADILQTGDTDELVQRATEEVLNKLMYKKPLEYLDELCNLLSTSSASIADLWPVFIEAKARRDLGVHNGWVCNQTYLRKVAESKQPSMLELGQTTLPTEFSYLNTVTDALYEISNRFYAQVK